MTSKKIMMVTPTAAEYATVSAAVRKRSSASRPEVQRCGVGMQQAGAFCEGLEDGYGLNCLVLVGWAGGLSPELAPGDIVLADYAVTSGEPRLACSIPGGFQDRLAQAGLGKVKIGTLLTAASALVTPESKLAAYQLPALAVEMEAYTLAAWAHARGIPFVHARLILDAADESVPYVGDSLDKLGRPQLLRLLRQIVLKPALLGEIFWLAKRIRRLNSRLEALAGVLVDLLVSSSEITYREQPPTSPG